MVSIMMFCVLVSSLLVTVRSHPTDSYDYRKVLNYTLLFYEAQRSGHLPQSNRIPWRRDSALQDKGINGEDLTGGYYDAGDYVKFGFTMAFATTVSAWGFISYKDAYKDAGQYKEALEALKWASDYFIKCHVSPYELYGQVGDFSVDHSYWGRPEDMMMPRPAFKIDKEHPGSDLAGETSAALSAVSLAFQENDPEYANKTLGHAIQLYEFATKYRGLYQEAIPGARHYYESTDYGDELTWAAIWLYRATENSQYIDEAVQHLQKFRLKERPNEFFYNKKVAGVQVMMAQTTGHQEYVDMVKAFCDFQVSQQKRTPKGLIYVDKFGTLPHAANIAFICLQAAELGLSPVKYIQFAREQINYMLGDSGRSYLVGFGQNYPKRPLHESSSCPSAPFKCDWNSFYQTGPNPQVLYGALVSGPNENDYYEDIREEYLYNEVTNDYNSGFQSAVAGLLHHLNLNNVTKN